MLKPVTDEICSQSAILSKIIISAPGKKDPSLPVKIVLTKKGTESPYFAAEEFIGQKAFHQNLSPDALESYILEKVQICAFRQIGLFTEEKEKTVSSSVLRNITEGKSTLIVTDDMEMSEYVEKVLSKDGIEDLQHPALSCHQTTEDPSPVQSAADGGTPCR